MFETITWIITLFSLIGVVLNIKKRRLCFYFWGVTNLSWAMIDFYKGIHAQGTLMVIYFGLSIWGLIEWEKR